MVYAKNIEFLKELGLTDVEARVYLCLLQEGSLKAGLISKILGIHRRSVYDSIDRLRKKGLVSYIKTNNINSYEATGPKRLLTILEERQKDLNEILPELEGLRKLTPEKKETLFFRGKASLKTVFNDQLDNVQKGDEVCVIGADINVNEVLKYYFPKFDNERVKKNIKMRMVIDKSAKKDSTLKKVPLTKIKYSEFNNEDKVSTYIYGNRVSIVKWGEEPTSILIKEQAIADRFKSYFELLWSGGE